MGKFLISLNFLLRTLCARVEAAWGLRSWTRWLHVTIEHQKAFMWRFRFGHAFSLYYSWEQLSDAIEERANVFIYEARSTVGRTSTLFGSRGWCQEVHEWGNDEACQVLEQLVKRRVIWVQLLLHLPVIPLAIHYFPLASDFFPPRTPNVVFVQHAPLVMKCCWFSSSKKRRAELPSELCWRGFVYSV